jgi:hypothetical protein
MRIKLFFPISVRTIKYESFTHFEVSLNFINRINYSKFDDGSEEFVIQIMGFGFRLGKEKLIKEQPL